MKSAGGGGGVGGGGGGGRGGGEGGGRGEGPYPLAGKWVVDRRRARPAVLRHECRTVGPHVNVSVCQSCVRGDNAFCERIQ